MLIQLPDTVVGASHVFSLLVLTTLWVGTISSGNIYWGLLGPDCVSRDEATIVDKNRRSSCPLGTYCLKEELTLNKCCHTLRKTASRRKCAVMGLVIQIGTGAVLQFTFVLWTKVLLNKLIKEVPWHLYEKCSSLQRSVQMGTLGFLRLLGPLWLWALTLGDFRWKLVQLPTWIFWLIKAPFQSQEWCQECAPTVLELVFSTEPGKLEQVDQMSPPPHPPRGSLEFRTPDAPSQGWGPWRVQAALPLQPLELLTWSSHYISVRLAPDYFPFCPDLDLGF